MKILMRPIALLLLTLVVFSCNDENEDIPAVEDRVSSAISALKADLVSPANGWRLNYRPTPDAGAFLMLLTFDESGNVNIRSDVANEGGSYFDETITYRIDSGQGLELIFETFGVFHFLFELDQATFGAEFEWAFDKKEGVDLVFTSISDISDPTVITLTPAEPSDDGLFSRDLSANLNKFDTLTGQIFGGILPGQQVQLTDGNVSIFWTIDINKRNIRAEFAGVGLTVTEVLSNTISNIGHTTGYSLLDGKIVLDEPFTTAAGGIQRTVSELRLDDFDQLGPSLCMTDPSTTLPRYRGFTNTLGNLTMLNSYLSSRGANFTSSVYSVNVDFLFDDQGNAIAQTGSINDKFPTASGFVLFYGVELNDPNIPIYSVGMIMEDGEIYVREFQPTTTQVNRVTITLLDSYYYSATPPPGTEQDLKDITDEIFAGGELYAFDEEVPGAAVFRLINPCNRYEIFLVN
ncbi:MAG: DUF4302 domain-containing protein [Cyclobacteriaceae bacterium]